MTIDFNLGDIVTNGYITGTVISKYFENDSDKQHTILVESQNICVRYPEKQIRELFPRKEHQLLFEYEREINIGLSRNNRLQYVHGFNITTPDYENLKVIGKGNLIKGKYNIGDRVVTNKTGPINIGTVCGKNIGYKTPSAVEGSSWDLLYPDWCSKPVYYIQLDKPNKFTTLEEWISGSLRQIEDTLNSLPIRFAVNEEQTEILIEKIKESYELSPATFSICAPEDDLSLIGDTSELFEEELCKF